MRIESRNVKDTARYLEPTMNFGTEYLAYNGTSSIERLVIDKLGNNKILQIFPNDIWRVDDMINTMKRYGADLARLYFSTRSDGVFCCCIGLKGEEYVRRDSICSI